MQDPVVKRKPKKRHIDVANDPKFAASGKRSSAGGAVAGKVKPGKNKEIANPKTGELEWGHFPGVDVKTRIFPAGPIRLRYGEHRGPNNGFGLEHIWEAHFKNDELDNPIAALDAVADFLLSVIQPGSKIFYEFGNGKAGDKTTVFRSSKGIVIVEERLDSNNCTFYSIVTAFPGRNAYGQLVGTMRLAAPAVEVDAENEKRPPEGDRLE